MLDLAYACEFSRDVRDYSTSLNIATPATRLQEYSSVIKLIIIILLHLCFGSLTTYVGTFTQGAGVT